MTASSYLNEDTTLDWDMSVEEIKAMTHKIKKGKSPDPDGLMAEHIIYGGTYINLWLKHIFNRIHTCKMIPHCFKQGITTPTYKGKRMKGWDPLIRGSYRGITVTLVMAKLLEYILLERMKPVLSSSGHPCLSNSLQGRPIL